MLGVMSVESVNKIILSRFHSHGGGFSYLFLLFPMLCCGTYGKSTQLLTYSKHRWSSPEKDSACLIITIATFEIYGFCSTNKENKVYFYIILTLIILIGFNVYLFNSFSMMANSKCNYIYIHTFIGKIFIVSDREYIPGAIKVQ